MLGILLLLWITTLIVWTSIYLPPLADDPLSIIFLLQYNIISDKPLLWVFSLCLTSNSCLFAVAFSNYLTSFFFPYNSIYFSTEDRLSSFNTSRFKFHNVRLFLQWSNCLWILLLLFFQFLPYLTNTFTATFLASQSLFCSSTFIFSFYLFFLHSNFLSFFNNSLLMLLRVGFETIQCLLLIGFMILVLDVDEISHFRCWEWVYNDCSTKGRKVSLVSVGPINQTLMVLSYSIFIFSYSLLLTIKSRKSRIQELFAYQSWRIKWICKNMR